MRDLQKRVSARIRADLKLARAVHQASDDPFCPEGACKPGSIQWRVVTRFAKVRFSIGCF